ncbi:MAG: hypothetical protein OXI96_04930 [Acidimicrobiaceae bacterium]|nr:hypothetical protein [Acidimicrobiaceae bacterium]
MKSTASRPEVLVHEHPSGDVVSVLDRLDGLVATGLSKKPDRVVGPFTIFHVDSTPIYDVTRLSDTYSGFDENGISC